MKHTKLFSFFAALAVAIGFATPAMAEFSKETDQLSTTAVITVVKDAAGNATVSWTGFKVIRVEHYVGAGTNTGKPVKIDVGAATSAVLRDTTKNGGYFNLVTDKQLFVHVECGGNTTTTMPTLKGLVPNCDEVDKATGQRVGRFLVQ